MSRTEPITAIDTAQPQVVEEGSPDAPALVLLTNAAAPTAIWDPVVPSLAAAFHVIRVDLLARRRSTGSTGDSPARNSGADDYSVPAQARRVAAVLDGLGVRRVTAIGHSSGCMVATSLAEQRPEQVASLALIDMGPDLDAKLPDGFLFRLLMTPAIGRRLWRLRKEGAIRKSTRSSGSFTRPVEIPEAFVEHALGMTYRDFAETMRAYAGYLGEQSLPARLTPLRRPVLVVFGAADLRWRPSSAEAYHVVPGARVEMLPGVGHTPMIEDPETTARLLLEFAASGAGAA